jgi:hypothetical protein
VYDRLVERLKKEDAMTWMKYLTTGLIVATGLTACTMTRMTSWSDPAFKNRPIGKTMVLGIPEEGSTSQRYEGYFVEKLQEQGVDGTSCYSLLQPTEIITEEELVQYLQQHGYDSILVTRIVGERDHAQVASGGSYPSYYGDYYGFYSHTMTHTYVDNIMEYILETNLYDVESRKLVWTGQKSVYDIQSENSNIKDVVAAIIRDLRKKNLL